MLWMHMGRDERVEMALLLAVIAEMMTFSEHSLVFVVIIRYIHV